ncbi:MAG: hypothetical protein ACRD1Y_04795 [Terriglobales bacterium]
MRAQSNSQSPSALAQSQRRKQIREQGYNAGFRAGVTAYRNHAPYSFQSDPVYQAGTLGDTASAGLSTETYQANFRSGFENGYDDGFYGRSNDQNAQRPRDYTATAPAPARAAAAPARNAGSTAAAGTVPAGTELQLKLNNSLSTRSSNPGDTFTATVTEAVAGANGHQIVVPAGSTVEGRVASVVRGGSISGSSRLQLNFAQLRLPSGASIPLSAQLSQIHQQQGVGSAITGSPSTTNEGGVTESKTRRTVGTAAAGGAVGALIGAIAGGGKGTAIGGLVGAGLGVVLASQNGALDLPAGTPITITLSQPLALNAEH